MVIQQAVLPRPGSDGRGLPCLIVVDHVIISAGARIQRKCHPAKRSVLQHRLYKDLVTAIALSIGAHDPVDCILKRFHAAHFRYRLILSCHGRILRVLTVTAAADDHIRIPVQSRKAADNLCPPPFPVCHCKRKLWKDFCRIQFSVH